MSKVCLFKLIKQPKLLVLLKLELITSDSPQAVCWCVCFGWKSDSSASHFPLEFQHVVNTTALQ